ncbi:MAG: asparagine synthase-related protein [bacterium]|nr:asparagine synthase-related protein [bacterium]
MSAIWGAISLNNRVITEEERNGLAKPFEKCVIDRTETLSKKDIYMAAGIQYFTKEAKNEKLPKEEGGCFYDADIILDNREELYEQLKLSEKEKQLPDGELQYRMIQKYGRESLNLMLGAFAFVYYNKGKNEITMAIDALGNRCVYYMIQNDTLYYSSLLEPLINITEQRKLKGEWFCDFLGIDYLIMFSELENTPIEGIYRIAPGQVVTINVEGVKKESYWNPEENRKEIHYKSDEEYKKQFCDIYKKAVESVMRSEDEISILLSGGLDSTSVACLASNKLKKQGRTLHSYTAVPEKGYESEYSSDVVVDETKDVLKTKEFLGNLQCNFVPLETINPWDIHKQEMQTLELPYKSVENALWLEEAMRMAYKNHSRVMLTGSFGNTTVSFSDLPFYMTMLFKHGRFIKFYKEFDLFYKNIGFSRRMALKDVFTRITRKKKQSGEDSIFRESYLNEKTARAYNCEERIREMYQLFDDGNIDYAHARKAMCNKRSLRQMGELETKWSLFTGVIQRDPTKDKRVFEFCLNLPLEQFVKHGEQRRLITCYMKDVMPEHVMDLNRRGMQSADLKYRMRKEWTRIRKEWIQIYQGHKKNEYVDCEKAIKELEGNSTIDKLNVFNLTRHMYTLMCLEYMEEFE